MDRYDLAVIGGGITGAGIARLAARNGLSVALFERGDLASGASSATSHMLHGGIRYLEHGQFGLVRESLAERAALARMAPSLARPRRFLVPFRRGDRRAGWMVRLGLGLYDALAGRANLERHAALDARGVRALEPGLAPDGLTGGALYSDVVMDDARLTVAVAMDAAAHGAAIATYHEVTGARPLAPGIALQVRDVIGGGERTVEARLAVNAAGAWADAVRARLLAALAPGRPDPAPLLRPTRGVHLVFPALTRGHGITAFGPDGRVVFVVPFGEHAIVGTTEVEVPAGDAPEAWRPSPAEVGYLRGVLARLLPAHAAAPALAITSGLRPLVRGADGSVGAASREHLVADDGDLLTIVGGKYTGFRVMARDVVRLAWDRLARPRGGWRDTSEPLPAWPVALDAPEALAAFAAGRAFARRLDDVIRRRSLLWLAPDGGRIAAPALAEALARELGWGAERTRDERHAFHARLDEDERLLRDTSEGA